MVKLQSVRAAAEKLLPRIKSFRRCVSTHKSPNIRIDLFGFLPHALPNSKHFEIVSVTQNFQLIIRLIYERSERYF